MVKKNDILFKYNMANNWRCTIVKCIFLFSKYEGESRIINKKRKKNMVPDLTNIIGEPNFCLLYGMNFELCYQSHAIAVL